VSTVTVSVLCLTVTAAKYIIACVCPCMQARTLVNICSGQHLVSIMIMINVVCNNHSTV